MFLFSIWTKSPMNYLCHTMTIHFLSQQQLQNVTQQLRNLNGFKSAGQGNLHMKDFKKLALILIFCKSRNTGGTLRSAFYLSSSFESAMQPFQPRLHNSSPNMVTGIHTAPKTAGLRQEFNGTKCLPA